jgi:hypothetical protein
MQRHTKIYLVFFGLDNTDFIECEKCGCKACDIHHIDARGMGGDPQGNKDVIENLMALCRDCHEKYGDKEQYMQMLTDIHLNVMIRLLEKKIADFKACHQIE